MNELWRLLVPGLMRSRCAQGRKVRALSQNDTFNHLACIQDVDSLAD